MSAEVSVVIAAYNVEAYIERAIRSALSQKTVAVEVIVVNDGSTDNTMAAASRVDDLRVKCVSLARNGGPGAARNVGFAVAAAPWIAVLDGDDVFLPGRLDSLLNRAKTMKADVVVDNLLVVRDGAEAGFSMFKPARLACLGTLDLTTFIAKNRMFQGGYTLGYFKPVFSSDFLRRNRLTYDTEMRIGEDYILLADALASGALCAVEPEAGYRYTLRAGSTSHRLSLADVTRIVDGDKRFLSRHTLDPAAADAQRKREASLREACVFTEAVDALKQRNISGAFKALSASPMAARHLWQPVKARIGRMLK